ncbi:MAG TPA: hypothetical protein DCO86_03415 [Spirochaetaceae bacterium]|nr:hypothetical protein [Spirochaetaceae bacterium]
MCDQEDTAGGECCLISRRGNEDGFRLGCNSCEGFYYHPIWKRPIYCPECGSFDVLDRLGIWKFRCCSCHHEFNLKDRKKENNNMKILKKYKELLDTEAISRKNMIRRKIKFLARNSKKTLFWNFVILLLEKIGIL